MKALIFDTEFAWQPGMARTNEDGTERIPHPPNAIVESIAWVSLAATPTAITVRMGAVSAPTEAERVRRFVEGWERTGQMLVTFNGRGADVPLLFARMLRYGIQAPAFAARLALGKRFGNEYHVDLQEVLGNYGAQRRGGLDDWARCIGWPGKGDVDGGDVANLLERGADGRELVDAYCLCDAVQTAAVFLRYSLATGDLSAETFGRVGRELLRVAEGDPRTERTATAVDRDVFLGVLGAPLSGGGDG